MSGAALWWSLFHQTHRSPVSVECEQASDSWPYGSIEVAAGNAVTISCHCCRTSVHFPGISGVGQDTAIP